MIKKELILTVTLLLVVFIAVQIYAQGNIVFVSRPDKIDADTGENADKPHIDDLIAAGYNITLFYNDNLSAASQATLDTLNNADLVIIGRSGASDHFGGDHKSAWNSIKAPMLLLQL